MKSGKIVLMLGLAFLLGAVFCIPAFAGSAFTPTYDGVINNEQVIPQTTPTQGPATVVSVNLVSETPGYWGSISTTGGDGGALALGATIGQPTLALSQYIGPAYSWTGFGMCIDSLHTIGYGPQSSNFAVYNFSTNGTYMNNNIHTSTDWYKLTNMLSNADVSNDLDRAALQLATWKGVQGDWNTSRSDFWGTYGSTYGFSVSGGNASDLFAKAEGYLALGDAYTGSTEVGNFKILRDTNLQMFAIKASPVVPEPMSIILGIMGLGSVAGFKRLRRS